MFKSKTAILMALIVSASLVTFHGTARGAEGAFKPTVALRLFGGLGYQSIGDLNTGLKGFSDSIIYLDIPLLYIAGGGYVDTHWGLDVGGDLILQLSPYLGVGIGSGYLRTSRTSVLRLTPGNPALHNEQYTFTPEVSVVPIRASLFVFVPFGRVVSLCLNAGPEYYLASISSVIRDDFPAWWWNQRQDKATGQGFGVHGGIGFEFRLSSAMSFILEGQGRLAKVNELTGTHAYTNSFGFQQQENGTLYYWTDLWTFKPFPYVFVNNTLPSQPWQQDPRKAVLDLSGWSAVAGFIFRF